MQTNSQKNVGIIICEKRGKKITKKWLLPKKKIKWLYNISKISNNHNNNNNNNSKQYSEKYINPNEYA